MNRFSIQDYPSDQTKGRSCSSCGDGWLWQVTIFVIDCYDVRDEDDGDGEGMMVAMAIVLVIFMTATMKRRIPTQI